VEEMEGKREIGGEKQKVKNRKTKLNYRPLPAGSLA